MNDVFLILLYALSAFYFWFVYRLRRGLNQLTRRETKNRSLPFISVIVAARNEEKEIEKCLRGLLAQEYPKKKFEVIVVDDGSTDQTSRVVRRFQRKANVKLLRLEPESSPTTGRKPDAITYGIQKSKGEVIATTDADCEVPATWLQSMVEHLEENVAFLSGPVVEKPGETLLSKLSAMEFLGLTTTGAGLIGLGRPINCSGANLLYRKAAFQAVNGFADQDSSCDDETLMQRIFQRRVGEIHFVTTPGAVIITNSNRTLIDFLKQRTRWAAKRNRYEDTSILLEMVGLYFFSFFLFAGVLLALFLPALRLPVLLVLVLKTSVDYFSLSGGARMLKQDFRLFHFLIAEIFHVPYIVIVGALGQFTSHIWKGRRLDR